MFLGLCFYLCILQGAGFPVGLFHCSYLFTLLYKWAFGEIISSFFKSFFFFFFLFFLSPDLSRNSFALFYVTSLERNILKQQL